MLVFSKVSKNFARSNAICKGLGYVSIKCEIVFDVLAWCIILGKIVIVSSLKSVSIKCQKFRNFCAADPSSPLC